MVPFDLPLYHLPTSTPFKVLGESLKPYWIVLSKSEADDPSLQEFLSKILKALGQDLNLDTYRIITDDTHSFYLSKQLCNLTESKIIISFGFRPEEIGLSIRQQPYQLSSLRHHQFLFCDLLGDIQNNPNKKRALWESLQLLQ